jgi:hypothetical protein
MEGSKVFFSEEKKQKTFAHWAPATSATQEQKSFGSFLQKRTSFSFPLLPLGP